MPKYANPLHSDKPKKKTYNMTEEQLAEMCRKAQRQGYADAVHVIVAFFSAAMLYELRNTFSFGQTRLMRIFERVSKCFHAIMDKDISYTDIASALREECDIELVVERDDGELRNAVDIFSAADCKYKIRLIPGGARRAG